MKTILIYYSKHHGNTRKLAEAIAAAEDVTLLDASSSAEADLLGYDQIGFASGIYYAKFHDSVLRFAENNLPFHKDVFLVYTCGNHRKSYATAIRRIAEAKQARLLGVFHTPGYDTFGPFRLIGGIAKGRPNEADCAAAVQFYRGLASGPKAVE